MTQERSALSAGLFPGMSYAQAVQHVLVDPSTRYPVRQRIQEDDARDPVDSVADAEILLALQELRLQQALAAAQLPFLMG